MRRAQRFCTLLAVSAAGILLAPAAASACSCAPLELDGRSFDRHDGAIVGKLVDIRPAGTSSDYVFRVRAVYRGKRRVEAGGKLAVRSPSSSAACGLEFPIGERLGLFLDRRAGRWRSSLCLTTSPRQMRRAAQDLGYARTLGCPA